MLGDIVRSLVQVAARLSLGQEHCASLAHGLPDHRPIRTNLIPGTQT